jgi:Amidohydrolase
LSVPLGPAGVRWTIARLSVIVVLLGTVLLAPPDVPVPGAAQTARAAVNWHPASQPASNDVTIFDVHIHYNRDAWSLYSVDEILALLDQAGISKAYVSSTPDDGTLQLYARAPDRVVLNLRPYRTTSDQTTWTHDPSIVPYLEERLAERTYRGIGEFHLLSGDAERQDVPRAVADLAASRGLLLHAHADALAMEQLLNLRPDISVLWAHAGMSASPSTVRRLLDVHPNLWVELALRTDVAPDGRLDPDWGALFALYPDRFMIGTDTWIPSQWTRLPVLMAAVRTWLRQLPAELAEAIAWRNAERLLTSPLTEHRPLRNA